MWRGTLLGVSLLLTGCQAGMGPAGPGMISPEAEALAGRRAAPRLERSLGGTYSDPALEARMDAIGRRLSVPADHPHPWHYSLLASDQVNAFSLPGGLIYITRGLACRIGDDDEQLAGVIAHEMSHILHRDSLKSPCESTEESLRREADADARAIALMRTAGYQSDGLVKLMDLTADVQPAGWAKLRKARLMPVE